MAEKVNKVEIEPAVSILTPDEKKQILTSEIKKTFIPAFISIFFALIFYFKFQTASGVSWISVFLVVIVLSYYIQRLGYHLIGVNVNLFQTKDWLYVEFLTIVYFWVFWTLLLNT